MGTMLAFSSPKTLMHNYLKINHYRKKNTEMAERQRWDEKRAEEYERKKKHQAKSITITQ